MKREHEELVTPYWDTHETAAEFCPNHIMIKSGHYICKGHTDQAAPVQEVWKPKLLQIRLEVNASTGDSKSDWHFEGISAVVR